jgi:hypothetical protein
VGYEEQREVDKIDKILNNYFNRLDKYGKIDRGQ